MPSIARIFPNQGRNPYLGPATVLYLGGADDGARIRIENLAGKPETWARMINSINRTMKTGDEVLVCGDMTDGLYIIGRLGETESAPRVIRTRKGVSAVIERSANSSEEEFIRVFSKEQELLFEYDPHAQLTRLSIPTGGLEFITQEGDIRLTSRKKILLRAQDIEMEGLFGVKMKVEQIAEDLRSAISINPKKIELQSSLMQLVGQRGDIFIKRLRYLGKDLVAKTARVQFLAKRIETTAGTIVATAGNVYRTIKELSQLKVGRKRTIVESTYHLKAGRSILKSDKDFKIKGDKIHLG